MSSFVVGGPQRMVVPCHLPSKSRATKAQGSSRRLFSKIPFSKRVITLLIGLLVFGSGQKSVCTLLPWINSGNQSKTRVCVCSPFPPYSDPVLKNESRLNTGAAHEKINMCKKSVSSSSLNNQRSSRVYFLKLVPVFEAYHHEYV